LVTTVFSFIKNPLAVEPDLSVIYPMALTEELYNLSSPGPEIEELTASIKILITNNLRVKIIFI